MPLIANNCELKKGVAERTKIPMIGCASHRFQSAVETPLKSFNPILLKIHSLMSKLRTLKLLAKLRDFTNLRPVTYLVTRWSGSFAMLFCYRELKVLLQTNFAEELSIIEHLLSPQDFCGFEVVSISVLGEDFDLSSVRLLFDKAVRKFLSLDHGGKYLKMDAAFINSIHFECGVVKVIGARESD